MDAFIVIDKPKGPTSHQIDYWVREITGEKKVGHIGTLDPNVTGVLVMALGKAVKLIDLVHEYGKEYVFVMRVHADLTEDRIRDVAALFTGEVYQIPPMRSAVARNLRSRRIYSLEIMEISGRNVLMKMRCDSGTYVRTLCTDMGYALGCGAQMSELRRISTGPFTEDHMITMQDLSDAVKLSQNGNGSILNRVVFQPDFIFRDTPKIIVKKSALKTISHGSDLFPGGIKALIGKPERGDRVCVLTEDNELVGTGKMLVSYKDINVLKVMDFDRILIEPQREDERPERRREDVLVRKEKGKGDIQIQRTRRKSSGNSHVSERGKGTSTGRKSRYIRDSRSKGNSNRIRKKKGRS